MKNLRLKAARAALDMSQAELAKRVNVSRQTIVAIEKGDYNPTIKLCIAICHELGKTASAMKQPTIWVSLHSAPIWRWSWDCKLSTMSPVSGSTAATAMPIFCAATKSCGIEECRSASTSSTDCPARTIR